MTAAPFKALLVMAFGSPRSENRITYPCTVTDVAAGTYVFPDLNTDVVLPSIYGNVYLVDVILTAAGTDTSTADIYVNGRNTPATIQNGANLASNQARQFLSAPIGFPPGARVKIIQRA